jgi:N-acetylneuraminate synthase
MEIKIGKHIIGKDGCFIIAEAGVNHNGSLDIAKKLVDASKNAGADAVKFQTFKSEDLVTGKVEIAGYQKKNIGKTQKQIEMLKKLELRNDEFTELKKHCDKRGIMFLSTPHTEEAIDFLEMLVPAYKIASGDITNFPFLKKIAKKRKPIILSTGMADMVEVTDAVREIKKYNRNIILLHCTTSYPCPVEDVNLRAMKSIRKETDLFVRYSDHTEGIWVSSLAVAMGAVVIEKHFTLDKNLSGPDHKASLEPRGLKEMVDGIRSVEKALGSGIKEPSKSEQQIKKLIRKSIVAKIDITKKTVIKKDMIEIKRPAEGIPPEYINKVIGKQVLKNIKKNQSIKWNMI